MGGSCSQNSASAGRGLHQTHAWLASSKRVHDGGETTCNCNKHLNFRAKNVSSKAARREAEGRSSEASLNYFYIVNCLGLNLTYLCGLTPVKLKILIIDGSNGRRRLFNFNLGLALLRILVSLFLIQIDSKTRRTATRVQRGLGRA